MGFKKLSEQELSSAITENDYLIAIIDASLKKINVNSLVDLINSNFNVTVEADTASEYILRVSVGGKTITTPNLKQTTIKSASIKGGHLVITMTDGSEIDAGLVMDVPEYGVCRDINSHSPELTRMADSVGLEAYVGVGDANVRNDFDNIYPWSEMRRCVLSSDGKVVAYEGEVGFTEDGAAGQVMVEPPPAAVHPAPGGLRRCRAFLLRLL